MENEILKEGDVVELKSGSQPMTIVSVMLHDEVEVMWFFEGGFRNAIFKTKVLKKVLIPNT